MVDLGQSDFTNDGKTIGRVGSSYSNLDLVNPSLHAGALQVDLVQEYSKSIGSNQVKLALRVFVKTHRNAIDLTGRHSAVCIRFCTEACIVEETNVVANC